MKSCSDPRQWRLLATAIFLLCVLLNACTAKYACDPQPSFTEEDYYLVILTDARGHDTANAMAFLRSLQAQGPDRHGCFGHAWIYLKGIENGSIKVIEGGHSGELGLASPKYFEGVMDLVDAQDPNPIRYLWCIQPDGYFEEGPGSHRPTYAAKFSLTPGQYCAIREYIDQAAFREYAITGRQCASFAAQAAALAGIRLDYEASLAIPKRICFGGRRMTLWSDPAYSRITFGSPDILEQSLKAAVEEGRAQAAKNWYERLE